MIYDYRCTNCNDITEIVSTVADRDIARTCDKCGAPLKRQIAADVLPIMAYGERTGQYAQHLRGIKQDKASKPKPTAEGAARAATILAGAE